MSRPDVRLPREADHPWHVAVNQHVAAVGYDGARFMYDAKHLAEEVPRVALLFGIERRGELPKVHHQCSFDHAGQAVPDNHLTCCLGVECRACPHLAAVDKAEKLTDEQKDVAKAWTCAAHIMRSPDTVDTSEGFVLTTDDRMYWDNVYRSMAGGPEE